MGYLFNYPCRKDDKHKDDTRCRVRLDPEYDLSCLHEGSLALTLEDYRGQSVYQLGV